MSRKLAVVVGFCFAASLALAALSPNPAVAQSYRHLVGKECGRCGAPVSISAEVGGTCPHCGAYWGFQRDKVIGTFSIPTFSTRPAASDLGQRADEGFSFGAAETPTRIDPGTGVRSPDGRFLARDSGDGFVAIYNADGYYRLRLPHVGEVTARMFSPNGDLIVCVDGGGKCTLYQLPLGIAVHHLASKGIRAAIFLPDGSDTIALANHKAVWFKNSSNALVMGRIGTAAEFTEVVVFCDSSRIILNTVDSRGRSAVFDAKSGRRLSASYF